MTAHLKGLVLAAGLGTRLRPLTDHYPKPLVPFAGSSPLELALWRLEVAGIPHLAVNAHYQSEKISEWVHAHPLKTQIAVSVEPEILGTGGAFNPLRSWLGDADLVVLNGDVVSTIDIAGLIKAHQAAGNAATMAVLPSVIPGESAVYCADQQVVAIGKKPPPSPAVAHNFACAQILTNKFLDLLPKGGSFDIISQGYLKALALGWPIGTYVHQGYWHDLRTPQFYWAALRELLLQPDLLHAAGIHACRSRRGKPFMEQRSEHRPNVLVDASCNIAPSAELGPVVMIEAGCRVEADASVTESMLLPGAVVARGEAVNHRLVGPSFSLPLIQT